MPRLEPDIASGSLLKYYQALWAPYYAAVKNILGATGTILPLGDPHHGQPNATTLTTVGEEQVTFTWSEAPSSFDTPLDLRDPSSFQGIVPVLRFNGTDEEADSPDAAYWSRVGGAFSVGAWVNLLDATSSTILAKYTESGDLREWRLHTTSGDDLQMVLSDEDDATTPNATIDSLTDSPVPENVWVFVGATYDGTANASGINLYVDGALAASTDTDDANFSSLRDTTATVELGMGNGASFMDGSIAGGPAGPFFTQVELTADQMLRLYNMGRAALGS